MPPSGQLTLGQPAPRPAVPPSPPPASAGGWAGPEPCLQVRLSDRRIVHCGAAFCDKSGWPPGALLGQPFTACFAEGAHAGLCQAMDRAVLLGMAELDAPALLVLRGRPLPGGLRMSFAPSAGDRLALAFAWPPATPTGGPKPRTGDTTIMQALGAAGAAAIEVDEEGRITEATPALDKVLGRSAQDLVQGRLRIEDVFSMSERAGAAFRQAREAGLGQSVLAEVGHQQRLLVVEWLSGAGGKGYALVTGPAEDEAGTEEARLQSELVSMVAHDIRNALAAVDGGLHVLADSLPPDSPLRDTVTKALAENGRATRISQDVLWLSRPGDLQRVELDVDAMLHTLAERFEPRCAKHAIHLGLRLGSGARILADLSSLDRGLSNLIENAIDATPSGGEVCIATAIEPRGRPGVCVSIRDTGTGIKSDTQPLVYDWLYTNKKGGTGLGLAIARRVVMDHQGQMAFESLEDQGTIFHVWLPALPL